MSGGSHPSASEPPEGRYRHGLLALPPGLGGLGWGLRMCVANTIPGDTDAPGLGTILMSDAQILRGTQMALGMSISFKPSVSNASSP